MAMKGTAKKRVLRRNGRSMRNINNVSGSEHDDGEELRDDGRLIRNTKDRRKQSPVTGLYTLTGRHFSHDWATRFDQLSD